MTNKILVNGKEVKSSYRLITDNHSERIDIRWDGTRFSLVNVLEQEEMKRASVIILNPREAKKIADFIRGWL